MALHVLVLVAPAGLLPPPGRRAPRDGHRRVVVPHPVPGDPGRFSRLIVQVTTVGREPDRVREILAQLRGYALTMPHELWVVTEPGPDQDYPGADRVITVPTGFTCRARYKARALEYSRRVRDREGL